MLGLEKVHSIWMTCSALEMKSHCFSVHIMEWGFMIVDPMMMLEFCVTLVNNICHF